MKTFTWLICSLCAVTLHAQVPAGLEAVLAPDAKVRKLADGFQFTEGPTADAEGNVFFTDQPNNRILKWSVDGQLSTFLQPAGRANGMCFDRQGRLIACADETNALWRIDVATRRIEVLAWQFEGRPLNGPNDVWVAPNGDLYFTDPYYQRPWWKHKEPPQPGQHVYRLSADGRSLTRVADDLQQPNGIIGSPDGRTLYVADIRAGRTWAYDIRPDGSLAGKRLFCEAGSDGMTLDEAGHLYLTGRGVLVFDRTGRHLGTLEVPERWVANVCFGGRDRKTLFITASTGLYAVELRHRGANPGK
ncbi:SMP-30/gluconolactonase/LRE family protein [Limisphaera ngatamarikiensis]|uniref:SMP-30/gluconolactonase/LRE family protein n=1 Tax=Limisphaera ngatamarikiensis TaxID=1324935 RepID=A0A6M1RRY3_9BACT|nr:SMP-30/gluconolactonase/LRE family protein [Limisphaera ngatamarikiensis]NGO40289.1 SMP-30/gluconolactonase/LRE family protein [Limisphaera ngatamarikiensis]